MDRTAVPNVRLQQRDHADGSQNAVVAIQPVGTTKLTFNGLGWVIPNVDGTAAITQVDVTSTAMTGTQVRPLRIAVTPGGTVRMCDPYVMAPDPRAC
jgi:hypothetical protein